MNREENRGGLMGVALAVVFLEVGHGVSRKGN